MSIKDEFEFIKTIKPVKTYQPNLVIGIGDDAAVYTPRTQMEQIICTDTIVEDIHFSRRTMSPIQIGYKALAVNISDIAAMGGIPTFYLVSIAIPKEWTEAELALIYKGMDKLASKFKIDLIGGDTVSSNHSLMITVTVIGETEKGRHLLRKNAQEGDIVFVTGTIGDSAAGLELLLEKSRTHHFSTDELYLTQRHQLPSPRVEIGRLLSTCNRVALNDISDGIASEVNEIAEASHVTIIIEEKLIPLSKELKKYKDNHAIQLALFGGEDFELIGTMSKVEWVNIQRQSNVPLTKIGIVSSGSPKVLLKRDEEVITLEKKGYNHFKK